MGARAHEGPLAPGPLAWVGTARPAARRRFALNDQDAARALALLKRFGWNATSFQCLEPGFEYWFDTAGDGCVAYVDTGSAWVAAGAPIAADERLNDVGHRFVDRARRAGRRVSFFATERRFLDAADFPAILIGEQAVWDPARWEESLAASRGLREQLRRARAKGVVVRALAAEVVEVVAAERRSIDGLIDRWLSRRRLPPMGFLVQLYPYSFPTERRFFAAERRGELVGFLAMVPVYARGGWLLEDLLRDPAAPNGTVEVLIDAAMRAVAAEGSRYATLGLAPLAGRVSGWLRAAARLGAPLYNFEGLHAFKSRLRPHQWVPIYVAFPAGQGELATIRDTLTAFAREGLLRFGIRSLLHTPEIVVRALTVLLAPWTILLALAVPARWFPARWIQLAWTGFDLLLLAGLVTLWRRWRNRLAITLAALISADAILTGIEVLTFDAGAPHSGREIAFLVAAVTGPTLAAFFLWSALRRARWFSAR